MKVLWLANIPSPYRVNFFNELGKYCDLTVLFERKSSSERDESWKSYHTDNFQAIFLRGLKTGVAEAFCPEVIKYLDKEYDHIVVTNFSDATGIWAIIYLKIKKISYEIESDGAFPGSTSKWKKQLKTFLLSDAIRYFSTAKLHDQYYMQYGAREEQIVRYPFTSIFRKDILDEKISEEEKNRLRVELGMEEEHIALAVGQFIPRKGYDVLIRAAAMLDKAYGVYIVGGQAPEEYLSLKEQLKLENVHFVDFKQSAELKKYYMASDVFVHPTREDIWGLVINEAMAYGLPVVTTDRCIAGLELIDNGINGFIVSPDHVDDLAYAMEKAFHLEHMIGRIHEFTVERMAYVHMQVWRKAIL